MSKKKKAKKKATTIGKCRYCSETWGPDTDVTGWELDRKTNRWITCPNCYRYRQAIEEARTKNRELYGEWLDCDCGAFDRELNLTKLHETSCTAVRRRR